jgi:hypothetical protein
VYDNLVVFVVVLAIVQTAWRWRPGGRGGGMTMGGRCDEDVTTVMPALYPMTMTTMMLLSLCMMMMVMMAVMLAANDLHQGRRRPFRHGRCRRRRRRRRRMRPPQQSSHRRHDDCCLESSDECRPLSSRIGVARQRFGSMDRPSLG